MDENNMNLGASPSPSEGGGQYLEYGYATANPKSYAVIKLRSKSMKKEPTEAESLLWEFLKNKSTGYKIRRQHIIGNFIVDFVCLKQRIIIEVDGKIHEKQKENDAIRTEYLNQLGFEVIRFMNEEVLNEPKLVTEKIKDYLNNKYITQFSPPSEG